MSSAVNYDRRNVSVTGNIISVRASAMTECPRRLHYDAMGEDPSDELPVETKRLFEMGNRLESTIWQFLTDDGWQVDDHGPFGTAVLTAGYTPDGIEVQITGTPDAVICQPTGNPEVGMYDGGTACLAEFKTRSDSAFRQVVNRGNYVSHPGAVVQIALYSEMLREMAYKSEAPTFRKMAHNLAEDAVIVSLNRSSGELHMEWFQRGFLVDIAEEGLQKVTAMVSDWIEGTVPERLEVDSYQCQSCLYRTKCGNLSALKSGEMLDEGIPVTDEEFLQALYDFSALKSNTGGAEKELEQAKGILNDTGMRYLNREGLSQVKGVENAFGFWNITLRDSSRVELNDSKVRYLLGPKQYAECQDFKQGKQYLEVRQVKRKS